MFGLGFGEILVILVIVLLVFGPEKLPDIARTLGKTLAELRRSVDDIKHELTMPSIDPEAKPPTTLRATPILQGTCEENKAACDCPTHDPVPVAANPATDQVTPPASVSDAVPVPLSHPGVSDPGEKTG